MVRPGDQTCRHYKATVRRKGLYGGGRSRAKKMRDLRSKKKRVIEEAPDGGADKVVADDRGVAPAVNQTADVPDAYLDRDAILAAPAALPLTYTYIKYTV